MCDAVGKWYPWPLSKKIKFLYSILYSYEQWDFCFTNSLARILQAHAYTVLSYDGNIIFFMKRDI